jgi:phosphoserine phosphatase RsbU/P
VSDKQSLLQKVKQLENEVARKDQDLRIYKNELAKANVELERLIVQVNDHLRQSVKIQKFLVPTEFPNIPGFEFSTKFSSSSVSGGDYFDIFEHFDKMRFGLFLSSASGYGMSALFLSVLMKMTYEIEDTKSKNPGLVLADIFTEMQNQCGPADRSALFYGVFDRRKFQMTYCNVGQPLVIHYHSASHRIELLPSGTQSFSTANPISDYDLNNQVIDLNPKDKVIFCSSGFLSLTNAKGHQWGIDEILSTIKQNVKKSVHELRNEIFYQALKFSSEQPKDLTVIVTEVKERIMKLASDSGE